MEMEEENKSTVGERKRRRFERFCIPPSDDDDDDDEKKNKIDRKLKGKRKRKRRGFDWYYLPSSGEDDHEDCRRLWSELPDGILDQVLSRLAWPRDVLCFGSVCRPWRSVREGFVPPPRSSCPLLVYRGDGTIRGRGGFNVDASSEERFVFYSLAGRDGCWGVRGGQLVAELPGTRGAYIRGCSHGWLFFARSETAAPSFLLNPATGSRIVLPLWTAGSGGGRRRRSAASPPVASSSPADGPSCVVAFLADGLLVFCRIGDGDWSAVSTGEPCTRETAAALWGAMERDVRRIRPQCRQPEGVSYLADRPSTLLVSLVEQLPRRGLRPSPAGGPIRDRDYARFQAGPEK